MDMKVLSRSGGSQTSANIGLSWRAPYNPRPGPVSAPEFQQLWSRASVFAFLASLQVRGVELVQGPRSQHASQRVVPSFCVHRRVGAPHRTKRSGVSLCVVEQVEWEGQGSESIKSEAASPLATCG